MFSPFTATAAAMATATAEQRYFDTRSNLPMEVPNEINPIVDFFLGEEEWLRQPVESDGIVYVTDGHVALISLRRGPSIIGVDEDPRNVARTLQSIVEAAKDGVEMPLDHKALLWALDASERDDVYEDAECEECLGFGEVECFSCGAYRECPECLGRGNVDGDVVDDAYADGMRIALFGMFFTPVVLHKVFVALDAFSDGDAVAYIPPYSELPSLIIETANIRVLAMATSFYPTRLPKDFIPVDGYTRDPISGFCPVEDEEFSHPTNHRHSKKEMYSEDES